MDSDAGERNSLFMSSAGTNSNDETYDDMPDLEDDSKLDSYVAVKDVSGGVCLKEK